MMKFQLLHNRMVVRVSAILLGALFVFSGLSKGVNPFGLSIQLGEYFNVLGVSFLASFSWLFAILLPAIETLLGFMLLLGLARRLAAWGVLLMMSFFTLLTLWIAITNPVNDCGCFGDLLKISNTATFLKNVVFMIPTVIVFCARNDFMSSPGVVYKWVLGLVLALALPVYTTSHLPLIDATPFKIGVNIPQAMSLPDGAPQAVRETVLVYKDVESGEVEEFSLDDTEWQNNPRYEFVESRTVTVSEGYVPPITSFPMLNAVGDDLSSELLTSDSLLLVCVTDVANIDFSALERLKQRTEARVVVLTSAPLSSMASDLEAYNSDYSLLRTMIQYPHGGAMLLNRGTIVDKRAMPDIDKLRL